MTKAILLAAVFGSGLGLACTSRLNAADEGDKKLPVPRVAAGKAAPGVAANNAAAQTSAALLTEYRGMRAAAKPTALSQYGLGRWCLAKKLVGEARAHFSYALELDPGNRDVIAALGLKEHQGRLLTPAQIEAAEKLARDEADAAKKYKPQFEQLRRNLESADAWPRQRSLVGLDAITDLAALKPLETAFAKATPKATTPWVSMLRRIPHQAAVESLVRIAALHPEPSARTAAAQALKDRPQSSYVPLLLAGLDDPIQTNVEVQTGEQGFQIRESMTQQRSRTDVTRYKELHVSFDRTAAVFENALLSSLRNQQKALGGLEK